MVAGAYHGHRAPSHAERPKRRNSREKGKGWQRSKSSMYEYGSSSDLYFSEERAMHRRGRRPQSSMSGRRTDKNSSSYYEIDCPTKRPPRRRASVEAIVKSTKPDSMRAGKTQPGPPIQKRMLTVAPESSRACITPNKNFYGWTQISKDRGLQQVHIAEREGPKAKQYVPRYEVPGAEAVSFPIMERTEEKEVKCEQRRMEMLVTTGPFTERLNRVDEIVEIFRFDDKEHYKNDAVFRPPENSPFARYVSEMRIELKDFTVPEDRIMHGQIFLDLLETATIDSINLDVNRTFATVSSEGVVKLPSARRDRDDLRPELKLLPIRTNPLNTNFYGDQDGYNDQQATRRNRPPSDIVLTYTHPKRVRLAPGQHAIPFELYVPESLTPSFTYVDEQTGATAIHNYSVEGNVRVNGKIERTGRTGIDVPALGKRNVGLVRVDKNNEVLIPSQFLTKDEGVDYALGQIDKYDNGYDRPSEVTAYVKRTVTCPDLGRTSPWEVSIGKAESNSGNKCPVLDKYRQGLNNDKIHNEWERNWYEQDEKVNFGCPSVKIGNFSCHYDLVVKTGNETYEIPIAFVDRYDDRDFRRHDLPDRIKQNIRKVN